MYMLFSEICKYCRSNRRSTKCRPRFNASERIDLISLCIQSKLDILIYQLFVICHISRKYRKSTSPYYIRCFSGNGIQFTNEKTGTFDDTLSPVNDKKYQMEMSGVLVSFRARVLREVQSDENSGEIQAAPMRCHVCT